MLVEGGAGWASPSSRLRTARAAQRLTNAKLERPLMESKPRPSPQSFNPYIGAFFVVAGITALLSADYPVGGAFLSVGAAFLVYWNDTRPWAEIPRWKRLSTLGLIFVGAVFLVVALITTLGG